MRAFTLNFKRLIKNQTIDDMVEAAELQLASTAMLNAIKQLPTRKLQPLD